MFYIQTKTVISLNALRDVTKACILNAFHQAVTVVDASSSLQA